MNNSNIFETLALEAEGEEFSPLIQQDKPQKFESIVDRTPTNENIFETLSNEVPNQSYSFLDTAKDVVQQIGAKGAKGLLGAYGNIAEMVGLGTKENLLPGQEARLKASFDNELETPFDDDILPSYARLPTSSDVGQAIEKTTGIGEGKTPQGRIAGRGAEFLGEGLAYPGGGAKGLASLAGAGLAGQSLREAGAPDALASGVEIAGSILPSAVQGRVAPTNKASKKLVEGARELGLTEKQITPLIQGERKAATLSKVARKGEKTKKQFASIKESLGDSYQEIKSSVANMGPIDPVNKMKLDLSFTAIRDDLAKTIKGSPDKEAAVKFIEEALTNLKATGATPESLINFWQDINKSVKWNSIQGGKKALTRLKEPILDVLQSVAPQAAKDFEMTNQLYTKYSQIAKKLKPDLIDSFANKAEIMGSVPAGLALLNGNPWYLASLGGEFAVRSLAKEMLTNPYFQNLSNKLVQNFNQGSVKGVKDLVNNAKELMERKYPEENWDFLISEH